MTPFYDRPSSSNSSAVLYRARRLSRAKIDAAAGLLELADAPFAAVASPAPAAPAAAAPVAFNDARDIPYPLRHRNSHHLAIRDAGVIHGTGVVTLQAVPRAGVALCEYFGPAIDNAQADALEREANGLELFYLYRLDDDTVLDAREATEAVARYINHSCDPNCEVRRVRGGPLGHRLIVYSKRAIAAEEELTYNYFVSEGPRTVRCCCGSSKCCGWVC